MRVGLVTLLVAVSCTVLHAADVPFGIPGDLIGYVTPGDNPTTADKIALGRKLFNDKRLSADDTVSCATCHDAKLGFTVRLATAKGIHNQFGQRNAPTVLNAMFFQSEFWDGRAPTLEAQAELPIVNPIEMGMKDGASVTAKLASLPEYRESFEKVFGNAPNYGDAAKAISAFERTLISGDAPIDHYLAGDASALTEAQKRGWSTFNGKGRCISCHAINPSYPFFTDNLFHNIGIAAHKTDFAQLAFEGIKVVQKGDTEQIDHLAIGSKYSELGRFLVTKNRSDVGAFKTPALRDVALTAPYMHDGSLETLWDVMDHYNKGGIQNPFLDGGIQRLGLTENEINDLVAVMGAFTSHSSMAASAKELQRQRDYAATHRSQRDTAAALGKKGNLGDVAPDPNLAAKDPATIGGRPTKY